MHISYSFFKTKFGLCLVASTQQGICNILFFDTQKEAIVDLQQRWPKATLMKHVQPEHTHLKNYFIDNSPLHQIKLDMHGTEFQKKVWRALASIQVGTVTTYGKIAELLGDKKLSRAVGTAIGKNPIGYIIPCHRVVKSDGKISGYRWGVHRKKAMLHHEGLLHF